MASRPDREPAPVLEPREQPAQPPVDGRAERVADAGDEDEQPRGVVLGQEERDERHLGLRRQHGRGGERGGEQPRVDGEVAHARRPPSWMSSVVVGVTRRLRCMVVAAMTR
jgi:hypothetical protein